MEVETKRKTPYSDPYPFTIFLLPHMDQSLLMHFTHLSLFLSPQAQVKTWHINLIYICWKKMKPENDSVLKYFN